MKKIHLLSDSIKKLRIEMGLTQSDIAQRVGVTKASISAYENSLRQPSYAVVVKLSSLFKVSCDYLLGCTEKDLIDASGLNNEQKKSIQEIISVYQRYNIMVSKLNSDKSTNLGLK